MKSLPLFLLVLSSFPASQAWATPDCSGTLHNVDTVTANRSATCVLSKLYEPDHFCIVDGKGADLVGRSFVVTPGQVATFAFNFDSQADFNMELALTCVADDGNYVRSPKTIFTIGAQGPADPSISVVNLYGAAGTWAPLSDGQAFSLTF